MDVVDPLGTVVVPLIAPGVMPFRVFMTILFSVACEGSPDCNVQLETCTFKIPLGAAIWDVAKTLFHTTVTSVKLAPLMVVLPLLNSPLVTVQVYVQIPGEAGKVE